MYNLSLKNFLSKKKKKDARHMECHYNVYRCGLNVYVPQSSCLEVTPKTDTRISILGYLERGRLGGN